jgi:hypothetical protein
MRDSACNTGETILLRFNNQSSNFSNAHTQLINATGYTSVLCCNSTTQPISNLSTGTAFLRLWNITNSHAQEPNQTGFTLNYSYSAYISSSVIQPTCTYYSGSCDIGYTCLLSISSRTNAHIASCTNGYSGKICCKLNDKYTQTAILVFDPSSPIFNNTNVNASCNGDLFRNNINVTLTENNIFTNLPVSIHNYSCQLQSNLTHYYAENNQTYTVLLYTTSAPPSGGGMPTPPSQNCTYFFSKWLYTEGEVVSLNLSCPTQLGASYVVEWFDNKGLLIHYETGVIDKSNLISHLITQAMVGKISIKVGTNNIFYVPFITQTKYAKPIGYFMMVVIAIAIIIVLLLLNKQSKKKKQEKEKKEQGDKNGNR